MEQEPATQDQLWVFGYGSLIWDPCFAFAERQNGRVTGWRRSFCMWSVHYRGTAEAPGLVLALDEAADGVCDGVAFRVIPGHEAATLAALRERELISYAYREETVTVVLADGNAVQALTYVINRDHAQYNRDMTLEDQAQIIAQRHGVRGPNRDYLFATAEHLSDLGLADPDLDWLVTRVRGLP
jgi:glutathione-specific gamma-glutamylcyclotransferase